MKQIRFSKHALGYAASRGFTVAEVEDRLEKFFATEDEEENGPDQPN